jgi:dTDP-4-amino-4,6-dideoxygalactose transaminase
MDRQEFLNKYVISGQAFPAANDLSDKGMYLPLYPGLDWADIEHISKLVTRALEC